jgi:hypothetical protein
MASLADPGVDKNANVFARLKIHSSNFYFTIHRDCSSFSTLSIMNMELLQSTPYLEHASRNVISISMMRLDRYSRMLARASIKK